MSILVKFTVTAILLYYVACETKCGGKTCKLCIGESVDCVWCADANHTGPRCQRYNAINPSWCSEVQNPLKNNSIETIKAEDLNATPGHEVQLTPQELKISIRPGQTVEFPLKYKPVKHYPLDVYFLMDVSYTMISTIHLLRQQGKTVYDKLNGITNNVMMGVGSFVEKAALPFANPYKHTTYSFKHHLNLTTQRDSFEKVLDNIQHGSNLDAPEAGLDALMQVMACNKRLGWRRRARKIIVLCTDSTYHSGGDGKIAGAAKLNDMKCHLNNDIYSLELEQDYPTVNQIRKIAKRENFIIIFNVKKNVMNEYNALAKRLDVGAHVIELKEESNITETIANVYTRKLGNVQMDVVEPDSNVRVKLTPDCKIQDTCLVEHDKYSVIKVSLTAESCLEKSNVISIKPNDLAETLRIKIETLCKCDCEDHSKPNATECSNGNGSKVCGICSCNENRYGDTCDCVGNSMMHLDKCKANADDTVLCSGINRGSCRLNTICVSYNIILSRYYPTKNINVKMGAKFNIQRIVAVDFANKRFEICGICSCNPFYSGKFCQFDDRACPKVLGKLCGDNGRCHEGHCKCYKGWAGDACQCPLDDTSCRAPHSNKVCSGNGKCECGECTCTNIDIKNNLYFGVYCDNCHDCDGTRCKELEEYVKCVYLNQTQKEKCDEKYNSKNIIVLMVNKTEIDAPEYHLAKRCTIVLDDGKSIVFKHKYEGKILHIIIQNELEEPDRANMWIAIGSAIGAILLIGLLTVIIWKVLVDIYDAREYKRFNKLLDESGDLENINEIYKPPTAKFNNPLFKRQSRLSYNM